MIFIHVVFEYKNNIFSYYIQDKKEKRLIFACGMIYEMQIDSCQIIDEFLFYSPNAVLKGVVNICTVNFSLGLCIILIIILVKPQLIG